MKAVLWALVFLGVCLVHWGHWQPSLRCSFLSDSSLRQHRQNYECWTVCFTDSEILTDALDNLAVLNDNIYIWVISSVSNTDQVFGGDRLQAPKHFLKSPLFVFLSFHVDSFKTLKVHIKKLHFSFQKKQKVWCVVKCENQVMVFTKSFPADSLHCF